MLAHYRRSWVAALRGGCLTALAACGLWLLPVLASAATPGAVILNRATLSAINFPTVQASVSVRIGTVTFLRYSQSGAASSAAYTVEPVLCGGNTLSVPSFGPAGGPGSLPTLPGSYSLSVATAYQVGEPIFLEVQDPAANLNPGGRDLITVTIHATQTGDAETLQLQETAADSGVFVGFINTTRDPAASDCRLSVQNGSEVYATYGSEQTDPLKLSDPYGVVFDSSSGGLLDGASVTLIDDLTGQPATVIGDGGEPYPATVVTGSTFSTSSRTYTLQPGEYRFPFVTPGHTYHLAVTRSNYAFPTAHPDSDFTKPAFASYVITTGSRGESFPAPLGFPLRVDLPVDGITTGLLLVKNADRTTAAIGDFVPYDIVASNRSGGALTSIQLTDTLPAGFRYRAGSMRQDGRIVPDPQISPDGRTLTHALGTMNNNTDVRLTYVAEATAATPLGEALNVAQAANNVVRSNVASASITVHEDLMRSRALVAGRVLESRGCSAADRAEAKPLPGARIYLEDGRYVVADVRGRWHFDDLRPGTHVLQLDEHGLPAGAEILDCDGNTRSAGTALSRFVDLQGGTLWQQDFYVRRPASLHVRMEEIRRQLGVRLTSEPVERGVVYTLSFDHPDTELANGHVQVLMPRDLLVEPGTLRLDGNLLADPAIDDKGWSLDLPTLPAGSHSTLTWGVTLAQGARAGEHSVLVQLAGVASGLPVDFDVIENRTSVTVPEKLRRVIVFRPRFATFSTDLTAPDRRWLDDISEELRGAGDIRLEVVGHTDNARVVARKGRAINDNYALSLARAQSVADYLKQKLSLADDRIQAFGKGPDEPLADNKTPKGRETNRRVELKVFAQQSGGAVHLDIAKGDSGEQRREWSDWHAQDVDDAAPTAAPEPEVPEDNGLGLLSHTEGEVVADRVQALRVRVNAQLKSEVTLDGRPIPEDRLGFTKDEGRTILMSYIGVDLGEPGPHELRVRGTDPFGIVRMDQKVTVVVASEITRIRPAASPANVADGRTPVSVKVELVDASGRVVPAAIDLRVVSGGGLRPWITTDADRAMADSSAKVAVGTDGIIKFAPVTRSGLYTIEVAYNNASERIPVYVRPEKREWILVALAEGSLAAKSVSGNMQSASAAGVSDAPLQDGRTAFFAKGQIQGKWLLTMAYDSHRERATAFGGAIDPARFYTLYADAADPRPDAASKEKLYLRIERDAFYALFGDFDTGMSEVDLARYNRTFTGIKTEYHDQRFDVNAFAADSASGFVRDEIRGDGTSGLYHLTRSPLLSGSEKVHIEVRDRLKSDVILSSQQLSRWADYNIDYDRGEIFFKTPVPVQDSNLNPVWVVVEYETQVSGKGALNVGGRAAVKVQDGRGVVGVTHVQEGNGINQGQMQGVDGSYKVTPADTLRVEIASTTVTGVLPHQGGAQEVEWKHDSGLLKGRAYFREQDGGFGLGQQMMTEEGTRRIGVEGRYQYEHNSAVTADVYQQDMLTSGASRQVVDVRDEVSHDTYGFAIGGRHIDESLPNDNRGADQLTLNGRMTLPGNAVKLRSTLETAFLTGSQSMDFPDRLLMGADWQVSRSVQLTLEQEWTASQLRDTQTTRAGVQVQPWKGAKMTSSVSDETSEAGTRLRSALGLGQSLTLTPEWTADFGYDRSDTLSGGAAAVPFNPQLPNTVGPATTDFWAANAGANYRYHDVKGVGRIERREATGEDRWNVVGGFYRELNPEIAVATGLTTTLADTQGGNKDDSTLLRGSIAWRPDDARWILLDRLDLGLDHTRTGNNDLAGQRIVNNLNVNHRWNDNEISLQYGSKFVMATVDSSRYTGYTDLTGIEWRRDLSPHWDIGWRNSILHSWGAGVTDYQYGPSVGMTPAKNVWMSLGYNVAGFKDADFSAGEYTAQGIYFKVRIKVDQHSIQQIWSDARGVFGSGSSTGTETPDGTTPLSLPPAQPDAVKGASPARQIPLAPTPVNALDLLAAPVSVSATLAPAPAAAPVAVPTAPSSRSNASSSRKKGDRRPTAIAPSRAKPQAVQKHLVKGSPPAAEQVSPPAPKAPADAAARSPRDRKEVIREIARAKKDLLELQAAESSAHKEEKSRLHRGEQNRRRERMERNERKVKKLLDEKVTSLH
ncbi:MAG TPA: OmpA family protein [Moraxellaceae bacterium]|nr:OmpA family protein [Moraxellaceae bacterium]